MNLWKLLFDTPFGPREMTAGEIVGRKIVRKEVKALVSEQPTEEQKKAHPVLGKLALYALLAKTAELDKEAPFKSEAQRRKFYAMAGRGEISKATLKEWEDATPDKKLPERVEKKAGVLGSLSWLTMAPGKSGLARLARGVGWASIPASSAVSAARQPTPSQLTGMPRVAAEVDRLLALTKESIEFHQHLPASTDLANPPDVKKKYMKSASGLTAVVPAVVPGAVARGTSALTKGPFSTSRGWLGRSFSGTSELTLGKAPGKMVAGPSADERAPSAGGGPHIQRGA